MNLVHYGDGITHTFAKSVSDILANEKLFFEYFTDVPEYWKSKRFPYFDINFSVDDDYIQRYWKIIITLFKQKRISIILVKQDSKPLGFVIFSHQDSYAIIYKSPLFIKRENSDESYGEAHFLVPEIINHYHPRIASFFLFITKEPKQAEGFDVLSPEALYEDEKLRFMHESLNLYTWKLTEECPIKPLKELIKNVDGAYVDTLNNAIAYDVYTKSIR